MAGFGPHGFDNDNFDKHFDATFKSAQKRAGRGIKIVIGLWLAYALGCFALAVGFIYVIVHFISKFW